MRIWIWIIFRIPNSSSQLRKYWHLSVEWATGYRVIQIFHSERSRTYFSFPLTRMYLVNSSIFSRKKKKNKKTKKPNDVPFRKMIGTSTEGPNFLTLSLIKTSKLFYNALIRIVFITRHRSYRGIRLPW